MHLSVPLQRRTMSRSQYTKSGLGAMSMVKDLGEKINGVGVLALTLRTFSHSIIVHMTSIDNSCSTFVDLILENTQLPVHSF